MDSTAMSSGFRGLPPKKLRRCTRNQSIEALGVLGTDADACQAKSGHFPCFLFNAQAQGRQRICKQLMHKQVAKVPV